MEKRYKIGEFAKLTGVARITLQGWDRKGVLPAKRTITGQRYYTDEDLKKVEEGRRTE